jgi:hypothetical protein
MMAPKNEDPAKYTPRKESDYHGLNRSVAASHFRTEKTKDPVIHAGFKPGDFFNKRIFRWLYYYLQSRFGPNHPYPGYDGTDNGVYPLPEYNDANKEPVVLGVVGDWGTYTAESIAIAQKMGGQHPHYTIHIGDTYYVGAPHEMANNFTDAGSPWEGANSAVLPFWATMRCMPGGSLISMDCCPRSA